MAYANPGGTVSVTPAKAGPRAGWLSRREALYGFAFISPWLIGLVAFTAGPLLAVFYLSFTEYPILSEPVWIGTRNYEKIFTADRAFLASLVNTAYYVAVRVPLHLGLAFIFALLLHRTTRGIGIFRTAIYLPSMIPIVALSVIWRVLLDPRAGYVNYFGGLVGLPQANWLASPDWAKPIIVFISLWQIGIPMIIFLAGLGAIPETLYEAAEIDGAGWWRRLLYVTVPMMTPVILYNVIIDIINSFQVFAYAFIMTRGGPNDATLFYVLYIYRVAFGEFQMGYASALSTILFAIVLALTVVVLRSSRSWVQYERI